MSQAKRLLGLSALATALFCGWAIAMQTSRLAGFDNAIRTGMHGLASPFLTRLSQQASWFGDLAVLGLLGVFALVVLGRGRRKDAARILVVTMLGALVLENGLKYLFQRVRPPAFFGPEPWTYSFPSGHALFSACFYGAFAIVLSRALPSVWVRIGVWVVTALLVLMIGAARIYLGVHYPSDVVGGYLVAIAWTAMALAVCQRRRP